MPSEFNVRLPRFGSADLAARVTVDNGVRMISVGDTSLVLDERGVICSAQKRTATASASASSQEQLAHWAREFIREYFQLLAQQIGVNPLTHDYVGIVKDLRAAQIVYDPKVVYSRVPATR